jgi:uracil-DNA glycosylase family 4
MLEPSLSCHRCPRLVALRRQVRSDFPAYHAAPVPAFGPKDARLLVVGLAPGMRGANASGRPFTGDDACGLLYQTLYDYGFSSQPVSVAGDGLVLYDCRITNAVKCLPPGNRPVAREVNNCNEFLQTELERARVLIALGGLAHKAVVRALSLRQSDYRFGHDAEHRLPGERVLIDSYHCSRYNTNTGRLTSAMFAAVFERARSRVDGVARGTNSAIMGA